MPDVAALATYNFALAPAAPLPPWEKIPKTYLPASCGKVVPL